LPHFHPSAQVGGNAMPSDFVTKKLIRTFDRLDTNGDKVLTVSDFVEASDRCATAFSLDLQDPDAVRLRAGWQELWQEMIAPMDADGDGRVTFAEFNAAIGDRMVEQAAGFESTIRRCLALILDVCDRDHDGALNADEFARVFKAIYGLSDDDLAVAFEHLDADGDGSVSDAELQQAAAEYWGGTDENARGNWFLGPL
jgi:Ca2+-binding EF-hand superfamily protein